VSKKIKCAHTTHAGQTTQHNGGCGGKEHTGAQIPVSKSTASERQARGYPANDRNTRW